MAEKELFPQLSLLTQNTSSASASGTLTFNSYGHAVILGKFWAWYNDGEYTEVDSDSVFYYDIIYSCNNTNRHLFGFERYDTNKTATSNNSCVYIVDSTSTYTCRHVSGVIDLSKDVAGNKTKYIRLRILNEWNHNGSNQNTDTLTIYRLSLVQVTKDKNTQATKTTNWISEKIQENNGNWIPIKPYQFAAFNSGTQTVNGTNDTGIYFNITSPVTTNGFGSGRNLYPRTFPLPYGYRYRIRMEVRIPSAHTMKVDVNNDVELGHSGWQGNDNDLDVLRTPTSFSIPANTWTTIEWGSANVHPLNTTHENIYVRDGFGVVTKDDSAAVTWEMRFPQIKIYKDTNTNFSIGKDGTTHANQIYEI